MTKLVKALEKATQERARHIPSTTADLHLPGDEVKLDGYKDTTTVEVKSEQFERSKLLGGISDQKTLDAYTVLRTQVMAKMRDKGWNTLMVTSPRQGEGKSTVATNLALAIAREAHQTALLVDTNFRRPSVASFLGLSTEAGLADYLLRDVPLKDLLINPSIKRLVVLPAGQVDEGSTELLGSKRMQRLVDELRRRYSDRYVIFDGPHLIDMPDALVFTQFVDAVLVVVETDKTKREDIQTACKLFDADKSLGFAMNKAHE